MLLRLESPAMRLAVVALSATLAAGLAFFSIRAAWAEREVEKGTRAALETSVRLEPGDFTNWYLLGRFWQYSLEEQDPTRAIASFRQALALNPRSADVWLDLAAVYESQDDVSAARDAYLHARKAYPLSAAVSWQYGNFLLRHDQTIEAFAEIRRATYTEPRRSAEAFSRCRRVSPDPDAVLDAIIPPDRDAYLAIMRELAATNEIPAALRVWQRLVSIHPRVAPSEIIFLTDLLIQQHQMGEARRLWDQAVGMSQVQLNDSPNSVVWDGGFESNVSGGGFAWAFPAAARGVQAALDAKQKHSGNQSLRLFFDGKHNANYDGTCTNLAVQPATTYRFSAWLRAQALTTDEGVRFRIYSWPDHGSLSSYADSQDTRGTQPWSPIEMAWTSGPDVHQGRVCILRMASRGMNPYIQGTVWVDDVALVPVGRLRP